MEHLEEILNLKKEIAEIKEFIHFTKHQKPEPIIKYTEEEIIRDIDEKPKNLKTFEIIYSRKSSSKEWKTIITNILLHGYEIVPINDHNIRFDTDWNAYENETYEIIGAYSFINGTIYITKN